MTGKELYELFRKASEENGCQTDTWEDLDDIQQNIWCHMAIMLWEVE